MVDLRSPSHRVRTAAAMAALALILSGCAGTGASGSRNTAAKGTMSASPQPLASQTPTVPADTTIVTIGDSIMAGYGLDADEAWPQLLADQTRLPLVNLACSGAGFVAEGDCGTDFSALAEDAVSLHPTVIILQSSDNDLDEDARDIDDATQATVATLHESLPTTQIIGMSTLWNAPWEAPESIAWSSDALRSAVHAVGGTFVSLGQPFQENPELLQWDGEHPTAEGQRVLAARVLERLAAAGVVL